MKITAHIDELEKEVVEREETEFNTSSNDEETTTDRDVLDTSNTAVECFQIELISVN